MQGYYWPGIKHVLARQNDALVRIGLTSLAEITVNPEGFLATCVFRSSSRTMGRNLARPVPAGRFRRRYAMIDARKRKRNTSFCSPPGEVQMRRSLFSVLLVSLASLSLLLARPPVSTLRPSTCKPNASPSPPSTASGVFIPETIPHGPTRISTIRNGLCSAPMRPGANRAIRTMADSHGIASPSRCLREAGTGPST